MLNQIFTNNTMVSNAYLSTFGRTGFKKHGIQVVSTDHTVHTVQAQYFLVLKFKQENTLNAENRLIFV